MINANIVSGALVVFFTVLLVLGLAGCNTIEGADEDIEAAGEAIERTADDSTN